MPSAAASILAVASMLPVPLSVLLCCEFVTNIHLLSTTAPGASTCSTCTTTPGTPYAPCRGASTGSTSPTVCSLSSGSSSGAPPAEARGRAASRLRLRFLHTGNLAYQISSASNSLQRLKQPPAEYVFLACKGLRPVEVRLYVRCSSRHCRVETSLRLCRCCLQREQR